MIIALLWVALGALVGGLANGARLGLSAFGVARHGGWWTVGLGALCALLGGLLGAWLLGGAISTPTAIFFGVVGILVIPRSVASLAAQRQARVASE